MVMSDHIRYSICSTHYNNVEYIEDSAGYIASVIKDRPQWELVISDAGSTDGSLEFLQELSKDRDDVRIIMAEGSSIGKGRQVALEHSRGDIVISLGDLDAVYYHDNRLFEFISFYEGLVEEEGDIMLGGGAMVASRELYDQLGGWNDLEVTERRDLKRRALDQGKLRFCDILLHKENDGKTKAFIGSIQRFYDVARMKLKTGIGLEWLMWRWLTDTSTFRPKIGALLVFPTAWLVNKLQRTPKLSSFNRHDNYAFDFQQSLQREAPEVWLEPTGELEEYA
jgi:glycosyltransferase involved in cell wall biosynthesis